MSQNSPYPSNKNFGVTKRCISEEIMRTNLSGTDRLVLALIHELGKKECYASNDYLSDKLNFSERQIERSITRLVQKKFLKRSVTRLKEGRGTKRVLTITQKICSDHKPISVSDHNDQVPLSVGGGYRNRWVIVGVVRSMLMLVLTTFNQYTTEYTTDSYSYSESKIEKKITTLQGEISPFSTQVTNFTPEWSPKLGQHLSVFAAKAIDYGKPLKLTGTGAWQDASFERLLHRHGEKRLEEALKQAVSKCKFDQVSFTFFMMKVSDLGLNSMPVAEHHRVRVKPVYED